MTATLCPGPCNARYNRARAVYEDAVAKHARIVENLGEGETPPEPPKPPEIEPVWGDPVWCQPCKSKIRRDLAELDELAAALSQLPPGIRPASDGAHERVRVSGSPAAPSPSPSGDDLDDLARWLADWETWYREQRGWPGPPQRGFLAGRITSCVVWLGSHLDGLLTTEMAEPFGLECRRWYRELVAKTHSARSARFIKKPCPRCRQYRLWEELGEDYIRCHNPDCNRMLTREELDAAQTPV